MPSPLADASDRLDAIIARGTLRVGTTLDTPVFSMRNAAGEPDGFDMDALKSLGAALGVKIEYVKMTFGTMLADLAANKFDIAMSGMGRTLERARVATFSKPYMHYGKLIVIRGADRERYRSLGDLDQAGLRIGHNKGGLNDRFAHTEFKHATPHGFASNEEATAALIAGEIDAQVVDSTAAVFLARNDPRLAAMDPANVFHPVHVAILLRREDHALRDFIDIWIDQIEMDGTVRRIRAKGLGESA